MMRKPTGHREKYSIKSEISKIDSNDGTSARTRPLSFDEIMLRRKTKKQSESVAKDQRLVYGGVESDRYKHRNTFGGSGEHASKEQRKVNTRTKEKIVEREYKESYSTHRRSVIDNYNAKNSRSARGVHEKTRNQDWSTDDYDHEHQKRHGKSEHGSKRNQNVYDDTGKKPESRKWHDPTTSEKKQKKSTSEFRHEDIESRSKRSRSIERERGKSKRSKSPSPRGQKQKLYDAHSLKDGKTVLNNGSNKRSKKHDASPTRLGGYSPRKRRNEAAVMNTHSSEKNNAGRDSPSIKIESNLSSLTKTELSIIHEVASVGPPITPVIPKPTFGVLSSIPLTMNVSVDSVQLTQATRPKRRIYVENLPSSASEAAVMQWLSGYLRPFGVSQIQGTSPCISCIVNKEKGQALVEFLTPEDASAALNFDGKSFSGNIVKIRRPKDYVEQSTGVSAKPVVGGAVSVKNIVEDSPNKIFLGRISKAITSEMLMEIASAFGPLKAYHFEDNTHLRGSCAFVEYADQSVTVKACVGLNGLKLGGQVLTATQATPDVSLGGDHGDQPFYGTPVHARPLLEKPTEVLKLNNAVDPYSLPSLSESELEEILEDIRLECARFGKVKSINIIKQTDDPETKEATSIVDEVTEPTDENRSHEKVNGPDGIVGNKDVNTMAKEETSGVTMTDCVVENLNNPKPADEVENKSSKVESPDSMKNMSPDPMDDTFEVGCVLVEYKRIEAASMAAHCLHGRLFDGRKVSVEYVAYDVFCTRFHK